MYQYTFILGRNPGLSAAEIKAVLPGAKSVEQTDDFLIIENKDEINCSELLRRMGGTIKIAEVLEFKDVVKTITQEIADLKPESKINFGLSFYDCKKNNSGMEVKKKLREVGISSRLVVGKEDALSSVIVSKNKCHEFLILQNKYLAKTCAVQEFEDYSHRDFGRPARDTLSGTLPPKLAQIMINLAQVDFDKNILDPFCGSGTILQEALLMGYKNITGTDRSEKAIDDSKKNLEWLIEGATSLSRHEKKSGDTATYRFPGIKQIDVLDLNTNFDQDSIDAIVAEPYLGPPLRGGEPIEKVQEIVSELENLYLGAFAEFKKVLKTGGKVVLIFPWFKEHDLHLNILEEIKKIGFTQLNPQVFVYSRPDQKVWREIFVFEK